MKRGIKTPGLFRIIPPSAPAPKESPHKVRPEAAAKARTGLYYYGPAVMSLDALFNAPEIAVPSVPAETAKPAAIMASNSAYSAAAAPFSSRRKRARKAPDLIILNLPSKKMSGLKLEWPRD